MTTSTTVPRIEYLKVQNFRALRDIELKKLTPLTVLLGPNGSGKSTLFDVFNFLSECFQGGLRQAWDRRGRAKELKTRGSSGPVVIEIKYREKPNTPLITYHLSIDETNRGPVVAEEWLEWRRGTRVGRPFKFLTYKQGVGGVVSGDQPDANDQRLDVPLRGPDLIAVNTLGQIAQHPRVAALRDFITDWYVSYLSVDKTRDQPESGPQDRLSKTGDNLANVVQYLSESHPNPDAIKGGTWEALERVLQSKGYFKTGLRKMELARVVAPQMDPARNQSTSFACLRDALRAL